MKEKLEYPLHCPVAQDIRESLGNLDDMDADQIKELLVYAAETLERQHEYLRFIHTSMKGGMQEGRA